MSTSPALPVGSENSRLPATFWLARRLRLAPALFAVLLAVTGAAQTVTFTGGVSPIGGGFNAPNGVAVDGSGNIYIADTSNLAVKQMPANCFSSDCVTTLGGNFAFIGPQNVAVDSNGNVYVVDYSKGVGHIYEMSPNCATSSCVTELAGGFFIHPYAVAVDGSGNVYVANNPLISHNGVFEMPPNCFSSTCVSLLQGSPKDPHGVAVDNSGNIYTNSSQYDAVYEMAAGCNSSTCTITTLGTGFIYNNPYGVAVDGSGNVFVTSHNWGILYELPPGCATASCVTTLNTDYAGVGVAAGPTGKVYYAASYAGGSLNNWVQQVQLDSVNFLSTAVGSSSSSIALWFTFPGGVTPGTASALTQGTPNLDFTTTTSPSCAGTSAGDVCEFDVTFAPIAPGQRNGAIVVSDSSGNVLATANIYGTGLAPVVAFNPAPQRNLGSLGLVAPAAVAVDGSGNLFIGDQGSSGQPATISEITAASGYTTVIQLTPTFSNIFGIAVDGGGNLFVADAGINEPLYELTAASSYTAVKQIGQSGQYLSVAVDGSGNLFATNLADPSGTGVEELLAADGYATVTSLGGSFPFFEPFGLALDSNGNVFVSDLGAYLSQTGNSIVYEIPAAGGYTTVNTLASGFPFDLPASMATDASGNVLVADLGDGSGNNSAVYQILASSGYTNVNTLPSSTTYPQARALGLDANGNIFVAAFTTSDPSTPTPAVYEIQRTQPPSLSFASTNVGLTSTDSPQPVTIENIGNAALTATGLTLSDTTDFAQIFNTSTVEDCTASISLAPGAECNLSLSFTPQSVGLLSATVTLTDNTLNASPSAIQSIALSGAGTQASQTITFTTNPPANATYGSQFTVAASASSSLAVTFTSSGSCTNSGATYTMTSGSGYCYVMANQAGNTNYAAAPQATIPVAAAPASQTITFTSVPDSAPYNSQFTVAASASSGLGITYSSAGGGCTNSGPTYTMISGTGTCSVIANQSGNANYTPAQVVIQTVAATPASQTITFPIVPSQYALASVGLSATASSGLPITYTSVTQSVCTVAGATASFVTSGTCTINANQAGDSNHNPATAVSQSFIVRRTSQRITFAGIASQSATGTFTLPDKQATASSGLPVTYSSATSDICTITGNVISLSAAGTCTIDANQAGDTTYNPAAMVYQSFTIHPLSQHITFGGIASRSAGGTLDLSPGQPNAATASSGLPVTYSVAAGASAPLRGPP